MLSAAPVEAIVMERRRSEPPPEKALHSSFSYLLCRHREEIMGAVVAADNFTLLVQVCR